MFRKSKKVTKGNLVPEQAIDLPEVDEIELERQAQQADNPVPPIQPLQQSQNPLALPDNFQLNQGQGQEQPLQSQQPLQLPQQQVPQEPVLQKKAAAEVPGKARIMQGEVVEAEGGLFHRYVIISNKSMGEIGDDFDF